MTLKNSSRLDKNLLYDNLRGILTRLQNGQDLQNYFAFRTGHLGSLFVIYGGRLRRHRERNSELLKAM
jgi:hypothetical protein